MTKRESFNFSKSEIDFFKNHNIELINIKSRWEWLDRKPSLIKYFFYEVIYPIFNRIPDAQEIRKIGYRTFLRKFRALGGIWGEVKKNGRFSIPKKKPLKKKQTWRNIAQEELDFLNKYKIKKENLKSRWEWAYNNKPLIILFFQEVIYPLLGYIPKDDDIKKLGYRGLIQPIRDIGKTVTEIINEAYRNKEYKSQIKNTWKDFTQHEIDFFEKYGIQWKNLKSRWNWAINSPHLIKPFFIEIIIPIKNRIPTIDELRIMGFRGLFEVIDDKFDYLNFINEISNEIYDKEYSFSRNIPIKKIDEIREVVKKITIKFLIIRKEPRSINYLSGKLEIGWSTFSNHAIKYLKERFGHIKGMELYNLMWESEEMKIQKIGVRSHILINDLLTIHFKSIGNIFLDHTIKYYSEPNIFQGGLHPDGLILLTPKVIKFFERLNNKFININLSKFKAIILDVTIDSSEKNFKKKILKYSKDDLVLLIISLRDEYSCYFKPLPITLQKNYEGLVKIIDFQTFKKLFGISGILEVNFDKIVKLISLEDLEQLYKISVIPKDQKFFTHNLKDDVKMIIKKKFKEYFNYSIK